MKNIKKILWAMMPVAAALMLASCSSDDDQFAAPQSANTIPYTVSVSEGGTRAAFADGTYTGLVFAAGDKLYINNADGTIYGTLTMQSGSGTSSATFSGELSYTGAAPTAETALTATLLSADNEVVQIGTDHVAAPQYGGICTNLAQAVSKYSYLSGAGTFGGAAFALSQGTAFLNFNVTLNDGEAGSKTVAVKNGGASIASGTVSGTGSVSFVAPVAVGTTLNDACVYVEGWKPSDSFGSSLTAALTAKVYNITKTVDKAAVPAGVQWIDLGIVVNEKQVLFADRNVGATSQTGYGDYFRWCVIKPCTTADPFDWANCPYSNGAANKLTKYVPETKASYGYNGFYDNKTVLDPEDDPAHAQWGNDAYLPTMEEWNALLTAYPYSTTTGSKRRNLVDLGGTVGLCLIFYAADNTELLKLPAAGHYIETGGGLNNSRGYGFYWSSSLGNYPWDGACLYLGNTVTNKAMKSDYYRYYGQSVRAVKRI
ncbi:MAG: hypothetical protein IJJ68_05335 [Prevotella sp.]|nr:hypothetical protein [Prevotella sp.]